LRSIFSALNFTARNLTAKGTLMLDNFRRRDNPLSRSPDPYSQLQGALAPRSAESTKPEASKPETSRPETSKPEAPKADAREHSRPSRSGEEAVSKLIVGPDIKLKGAEITDCDTLVVEGRVEASMDSRVIQISEHGVFVGKVGIDVAEIRGRFEGELTARKQLVVRATGRVSGKIRYGRVAIEEGGELSGDVAALAAAKGAGAARATGSDSSRSAPAAGTAAAHAPAQAGAEALFAKPAAPH